MTQDKKQLSAHGFKDLYQGLGIDLATLGCVMLDLNAVPRPASLGDGDLYVSKDPKRFWIDGWVADSTPHATVLYGLLTPAYEQRARVFQVLDGWDPEHVTVERVGFFPSPYPDEPYWCVVAHVFKSPELLEGHDRLSFLPHVDTFAGYQPHVTLGYIPTSKGEAFRDVLVATLGAELTGVRLRVDGINLGSRK